MIVSLKEGTVRLDPLYALREGECPAPLSGIVFV